MYSRTEASHRQWKINACNRQLKRNSRAYERASLFPTYVFANHCSVNNAVIEVSETL